MKTEKEKIYLNGEEKTYCSKCFDGKQGCKKMTRSILSDDGTHYYCEECKTTK